MWPSSAIRKTSVVTLDVQEQRPQALLDRKAGDLGPGRVEKGPQTLGIGLENRYQIL